MSFSDERFLRLGAHPGGAESTLRLVEMAGFSADMLVLDLCCGSGASLSILADIGIRATGADSDPAQIEQCKKRGQHAVCAEATSLPFADCEFDGALIECSASVLENEGVWLPAQEELCRVLKKGARVAVSDFGCVALAKSFSLISQEDATAELKRYIAAWLWEYGDTKVCCAENAYSGYYRSIYETK